MKEIVYLTRYYLTKYNTAEYCTLMDRFINQTVAVGADTLHYEEADMTRLRQLHSQLQILVMTVLSCLVQKEAGGTFP